MAAKGSVGTTESVLQALATIEGLTPEEAELEVSSAPSLSVIKEMAERLDQAPLKEILRSTSPSWRYFFSGGFSNLGDKFRRRRI